MYPWVQIPSSPPNLILKIKGVKYTAYMKFNGKILCTLIRVCCVCEKKLGTETYERDDDGKPICRTNISHSYCENCFEDAMMEIKNRKANESSLGRVANNYHIVEKKNNNQM